MACFMQHRRGIGEQNDTAIQLQLFINPKIKRSFG